MLSTERGVVRSKEMDMASQGFKNPNQFRKQLDEQLQDKSLNPGGYQPKHEIKNPIPPPKKP